MLLTIANALHNLSRILCKLATRLHKRGKKPPRHSGGGGRAFTQDHKE